MWCGWVDGAGFVRDAWEGVGS